MFEMDCTAEQETKILLRKFIRRGLNVFCINPTRALLLPPPEDKKSGNDYYSYLKKYSFRLFLRDVIRHRDGMSINNLQKYCPEDTAGHYLEKLLSWSMLAPENAGRYRLAADDIHSFGDTFEWFIAQVLMREFYCPAAWGIRFKETPGGGDYDIIASVEDCLLYIEAKSSPPKHIDSTEIAAFLDRVNDLRPQFCIFLEDTHLRMKDKIAVMFEQELASRQTRSGTAALSVKRLERELFTIGENIFIINSKADVIANIRVCISTFLRSRGIHFNH